MLIETTDIGGAVTQAINACEAQPVMNMTISVKVDLPTRDGFVSDYLKFAKDWQSNTRPLHLRFNHGEYIFRHGDALSFLEEELQRKPTSNRACVSLVDGKDIMSSGDGALPSFLVLQAGFQADSLQTLFITAYFRALEVKQFLPINLAELSLVADRLANQFPTVKTGVLTLFAFRAHANEGFGNHAVSELDRLNPFQIGEIVATAFEVEDFNAVIALLESKRHRETVVDTSGLEALSTEFSRQISLGGFAETLQMRAIEAGINSALTELTAVQSTRSRGTHGATLERLQGRFEERLDEVISALRITTWRIDDAT
ncbi:hypothetical protein [Aestuariimicrobium sp. Y1814]|uniref:hypothetical protein n=1 Tax=Aestuariimicrobium sp. Y1814 TaxID=3418742 RepID=UPI003DA707E2